MENSNNYELKSTKCLYNIYSNKSNKELIGEFNYLFKNLNLNLKTSDLNINPDNTDYISKLDNLCIYCLIYKPNILTIVLDKYENILDYFVYKKIIDYCDKKITLKILFDFYNFPKLYFVNNPDDCKINWNGMLLFNLTFNYEKEILEHTNFFYSDQQYRINQLSSIYKHENILNIEVDLLSFRLSDTQLNFKNPDKISNPKYIAELYYLQILQSNNLEPNINPTEFLQLFCNYIPGSPKNIILDNNLTNYVVSNEKEIISNSLDFDTNFNFVSVSDYDYPNTKENITQTKTNTIEENNIIDTNPNPNPNPNPIPVVILIDEYGSDSKYEKILKSNDIDLHLIINYKKQDHKDISSLLMKYVKQFIKNDLI